MRPLFSYWPPVPVRILVPILVVFLLLFSKSYFRVWPQGFDSDLFRVQLHFYQLQKTYQAKY